MPETESPEYHVRTHPSTVEHWRHLIEIVAFVVAAAWGFYVFVYQEDIKPALERPNVDATVDVQHAALGNDKELIAVTASWKNRGGVPAQLDGFLLNVSGISYTTHHIATWHSEVSKALYKVNNGLDAYSRGMPGTSTPLYAMAQRWLPLGKYMRAVVAPGDSFTWTRTFVIPQAQFNAARVTYSWCARRADDRGTFLFQPVRLSDGTYDVASLLADESRQRDLMVECHQLASGMERGI